MELLSFMSRFYHAHIWKSIRYSVYCDYLFWLIRTMSPENRVCSGSDVALARTSFLRLDSQALLADQVGDVGGDVGFWCIVREDLPHIVLFIDHIHEGSVIDQIIRGAL